MDTWDVNDKEFRSVLNLSANKKLDFFVHKVADWRQVWVLAREGHELAIVKRDDGQPDGLAVWPHERYAEACRVRGWSECEPAAIELDNCLSATLPEAEAHGHEIALLHSAENHESVPIPPGELRRALETELEKY